MQGWEWRAWVGGPNGGKIGSAFLVSPRLLLTAAHVVAGMDEVRVGFPGVAEDLPVQVRPCTGWRVAGDPGDVAVLELAEPVGITPARFAAPGRPAPDARPDLGTYGFPRRKDGKARYAAVTTGPDLVQNQEWWQLATVGPGEWLEHGYSGAAVYDLRTGDVVGMVTDAELREGKRGSTGLMLPVASLRRHWEPLDDLLPLTWLTPAARRELRELLDGVPADEAAVMREIGRRPLRPFTSMWDTVRYVAEGWPEERLARYLRALRRPGLGDWARRHLPGPADPAGGMASIIVRLERVTHDGAFDLTVHTWLDGAEGPAQKTVRVPEKKVRAAVEEQVQHATAFVAGRRDWMIEFAVPEGWLGKPFETWYIDRAQRLPMRLYPIVVRDVKRLRPHSILWDQAKRRWELLLERGRSDPEPIGCKPRPSAAFRDWLEANTGHCVLVYGARPAKGALSAALKTGVPVMLWPRAACDPGHDDCAGRRDALVARVAAAHPADLPAVALALRREALVAPDAAHCGRDLTLLWDDPSRLPDPPLAMEV
ncbi:VMAP-C domain-containing protein [Actinomadura macrotermitis]|uniref:Trypsin-like peptidase domain-containing protein n=1 Tax=Actinomadura macrotermitis TaxID=2585200 RepID=A0A7K0BRG3_9ACTN|nr:trypsin-like peptidase domain-containing protein [Actinomadura macrotermitis]MQY03793.1 hypothetical protein [Actinomadura macrotermitis]